jgi:hypothetical protein
MLVTWRCYVVNEWEEVTASVISDGSGQKRQEQTNDLWEVGLIVFTMTSTES